MNRLKEVTVSLPEATVESWKWSCIRLLNDLEPELILDLMDATGARSTMDLPAEVVISAALKQMETALGKSSRTERQ